MLKKITLVIVLLSCTFLSAQHFPKEYLESHIKRSKIFGDSLKVPVYTSDIWGFKNQGVYFISNQEGKWALKDSIKNKLIIPFEIDSVLVQFNAPNIKSYTIKRNEKWESYTFTKKYKMKKANPYSGLAWSDNRNDVYKGKEYYRFQVIYNGKRGIMNGHYEWIIPVKYDYVLDLYTALTEGYRDSLSFVLYNNDKVGLYNNKVFIPPKYEDIGAYVFRYDEENAMIKVFQNKNYFGVTINGKMGVMNFNKELILPNIYDEIIFCEPYSDNMTYKEKFIVRVGQKYGVINITGDMLIPIEYNSIEYDETFEKLDRFFVRKNKKYGIINSENEIIKPIEFTRAQLVED